MNKTTKRRSDTRAAMRSLLKVQRGLVTAVGLHGKLLREIRDEQRARDQLKYLSPLSVKAPPKYEGYREYRDDLLKPLGKTVRD